MEKRGNSGIAGGGYRATGMGDGAGRCVSFRGGVCLFTVLSLSHQCLVKPGLTWAEDPPGPFSLEFCSEARHQIIRKPRFHAGSIHRCLARTPVKNMVFPDPRHMRL